MRVDPQRGEEQRARLERAAVAQADLAETRERAEMPRLEPQRLADVGDSGGVLPGDTGDPDTFFFLRGCSAARPGGQNLTKWCNKEFDDRLVKARALSTQAERAPIYEEMQAIQKEDAPDFTIAHSIVYEAMRKEVTGYKQGPLGSHEFQGVDVK